MSLEYVFSTMPSHIKDTIKIGMGNEHMRVFLHDAVEFQKAGLEELNTDLSAAEFKLEYLAVKKSIMAYEELLTLVTKLKEGTLK